MSNQTSYNPEHDEFFSMLPWYVNQSLELSQRESVSRHVSQCDECQREVQFLASLNETVNSEATIQYDAEADIGKSLESVMNRIDTDAEQVSTVVSWPTTLKEKLENLFSFPITVPNARWGATALAGILVAVLGFQMFFSQTDDDYTVLSSSNKDNVLMRLSVEMTSVADTSQAESVIKREFEKLGKQVEFEKLNDETIIVTLKEAVGVSELNNIIVDLQSEVYIERVELLP